MTDSHVNRQKLGELLYTDCTTVEDINHSPPDDWINHISTDQLNKWLQMSNNFNDTFCIAQV